jgi:nucleoside-diphosphate-sugar epimerase
MLKIVITGSKGFLGSALIQRLKSIDCDIIEIDIELGHDISNMESISDIGPFDILIHLAAKSFVPQSYIDPASFYKVNVLGTINALELCRKYQAKMIYTSSYIYGLPDYLPIDELHPIRAFNPYSQTKIIGEELCKAYYRDFEIPSIILRPFNIFGIGQNENFLIPSIIKQVASGIIELKDPRPKRDFIYMDDVVDAYIRAISFEPNKAEIFNLGSGKSYSIKDVASIIQNSFNEAIDIHFTNEYRKTEIMNTIANISKINKLCNWEPKVTFEEGISKIINQI